jgi:hypothetical protein
MPAAFWFALIIARAALVDRARHLAARLGLLGVLALLATGCTPRVVDLCAPAGVPGGGAANPTDPAGVRLALDRRWSPDEVERVLAGGERRADERRVMLGVRDGGSVGVAGEPGERRLRYVERQALQIKMFYVLVVCQREDGHRRQALLGRGK